jgi:polyisoprenoid-binding protein YceI
MKHSFHWQHALIVFAVMFFCISCDKAPKGDQVIITDEILAKEGTGKAYVLDTANSYIQFTGFGVGKSHPGTFYFNYGKVTANEDKVTGGTIIIDITSLDLKEEGEMFDTKLRPHLLSGDFFDAERFGTSEFQITRIEPYKPKDGEKSLVEGANFSVSGNLEIKNVTKNITFPARIDMDGNTLTAEANFNIDRRQWQMNYGNDNTLGDKFISETVNIELHVEARNEDARLF